MLRLPPFRYHRPGTVAQALGVMGEHAGDAMYVAGGTDLIPNMKHRLFEPGHLVALKRIHELGGIRVDDGHLRIGAAETLSSVATNPEVVSRFPALADAAGHVAGPQLRNSGTISGNLCLDTRCSYYDQTAFWRGALGYCLKKDGAVCHVTKVGKKCVAAHSADTPPVLMTLAAVVTLVGPGGRRQVAVRDFFVTNGHRQLAPRAGRNRNGGAHSVGLGRAQASVRQVAAAEVDRLPSVDDSDCRRPRRGWHGAVDRRRCHRPRSATTRSHGLA